MHVLEPHRYSVSLHTIYLRLPELPRRGENSNCTSCFSWGDVPAFLTVYRMRISRIFDKNVIFAIQFDSRVRFGVGRLSRLARISIMCLCVCCVGFVLYVHGFDRKEEMSVSIIKHN